MSPDKLFWISLPSKKSKKRTAYLVLALFAVWSLVYWASGYSWAFLFLAVLILTGSLSPYFFPTYFELTREKVLVKFLAAKKEKNWSDFQSFYPDKNGVFLSPFSLPRRLENYRGLYLRYDNNEAEVLAYVRSKISQPVQETLTDT